MRRHPAAGGWMVGKRRCEMDDGIKTMAELMQMRPRKQSSGCWAYRMATNELVLLDDHDRGIYWVDLDRCCTSAQILDWIAQVAGKNLPAAVVGELVFTLNDYLRLQKNFCSWGMDQGAKTADEVAAIAQESAARFAGEAL